MAHTAGHGSEQEVNNCSYFTQAKRRVKGKKGATLCDKSNGAARRGLSKQTKTPPMTSVSGRQDAVPIDRSSKGLEDVLLPREIGFDKPLNILYTSRRPQVCVVVAHSRR